MLKILLATFTRHAAPVYGVTAKLANGLNWLVVAAVVSTHMSMTAQGYFFTFLSLGTIQMLFDLGLGMAIVQFAAHEWVLLNQEDCSNADRQLTRERLASVAWLAVCWYAAAAVVFFVVLQFVGYFLFHNSTGGKWVGAWLFLTLMVALDLAAMGVWSVLEGCGRAKNVYLYRALKAVVLGAVVWTSILGGAGLYSLGWGYLAVLPLTLGMLSGGNFRLLSGLLSSRGARKVHWAGEVAPLQWRLAVSFVAAYFAQWGITPITFRLFSPAIAGQFGLVWSIINAISAVANIVVSVQASRYGALIASEQYRELDRLALRWGVVSVLFGWLGFAMAAAGIYVLNRLGSPLAGRVLPLGASLIMFAASAVVVVINPLAVYLRSHKKEPYLGLSLSLGGGVVAATVIGASLHDPIWVALCYLVLVLAFVLPMAVRIFLRCRRQWHGQWAPAS